ncbi:MAG: type II toxin-antitoxin system RelE/ParE family toxin [Burkholderiaceae bacterium]|nr:type II toxin-antitoxin system RelE/ParE family toxin [Burkholderiaceae bacterium]
MIQVRKTKKFADWIDSLRDLRARAKILIRLERLIGGNPGDVRPVGSGVSELRIHYGPGYRVYFFCQRKELIVLLVGGDKSSQQADIDLAITLANNLQVST